MQAFPHLGAFESTHIFGSGQDVLGTTHHIERWRFDLDLLLASGMKELRYPTPWHRMERRPGEFDFSWLDGPMGYMQTQGMRPILDLLHHTSFPDWLAGGFSNPAFPELFLRFAKQVADRYPWCDRYTVFNEPLATTVLCSLTGDWYPHKSSDGEFARMAIQVARAICMTSAMLREKNSQCQLVRIDTGEYHHALDKKAEPHVAFCNERRFLYDDLTAGCVGKAHPLHDFLLAHDVPPDDLARLADMPVNMDIFGLDYYSSSEIDWRWNSRKRVAQTTWPVSTPRGFASVAGDYAKRFRKPLMLTETNVRGTVADRITWLKHMEEQCEMLVSGGADLRGFCWFPSIDSTDWDRLCAKCNYSVDPQGIWWLDAGRWERHPSELSYRYGELATGKVTANSLPAYRFVPPLERDLAGHRKLMNHWNPWITL